LSSEGKTLEQVESEGIIIGSCCKIENTLKEKKAYDKKSATDILEFGAVLDIMEKGGLIAKTQDGKYYITKKGKQKQLKGFKIAIK
jgi:hypothetical protein